MPCLPGTTDAEQREEHQKRIGEGVALLAEGHSGRWTAEQTGIPRTTLRRAYERVRAADSDQQKEGLDDIVVGHAYAIAQITGERLAKKAAEGKLSTELELRAYGISTDKIALRRRWARPEDVGSVDWLSKLASGMRRVKSVTVELEQDAVDVTPVDVSTS